MANAFRLRSWQQVALRKLENCESKNFLTVATPGAGKTTFALTAARRALVSRRTRRIAVVVPTQHLKLQWAEAAERLDIHLDPDWSRSDGPLPSDVHGVVVTYQQVAASPSSLRTIATGSLTVLDEIHHAADSRSWGDAVRQAFEPAALRLCLSGTPFRSDQSTIPFVRYEGELACADYEYGYGDALRDRRVVRPVHFPRINGHMEWTAPDGRDYSHSFDDSVGAVLAGQRLRTALDLQGEWLPSVLRKAHSQLTHVRKDDPRAAGMVIAMDQDHARGIAAILREQIGVSATLATSDDPTASRKIAEFSASDQPWIVAVRMVSEGVDIPRLRVGVYATNTITDLFFRQAVGRLVRWHGPIRRQRAYMFIPDDPRLRGFAHGIAEQRRHSLRREDREEREFEEREEDGPANESDEEQLSLFAAISATPLDEEGRPLDHTPVRVPAVDPVEDEEEEEEPFELVAPEPNPEMPAPEPVIPEAPGAAARPTSSRARRRELRELNSSKVRALVHATRRGHAEVNAELNRQVGIQRITEATVKQLEHRLEMATRWLRKL